MFSETEPQPEPRLLLRSVNTTVKRLGSILTSTGKPDQTLINNVKELASDAQAVLSQSSQELLQHR